RRAWHGDGARNWCVNRFDGWSQVNRRCRSMGKAGLSWRTVLSDHRYRSTAECRDLPFARERVVRCPTRLYDLEASSLERKMSHRRHDWLHSLADYLMSFGSVAREKRSSSPI